MSISNEFYVVLKETAVALSGWIFISGIEGKKYGKIQPEWKIRS
jgi:hypothetical protein